MLVDITVKGTNRFLQHKDLKYINLFGVELEGGWEDNPDYVNYVDHTEKIDRGMIHDGSVRVDNGPHNCHIHKYHRFLEEDEECDDCDNEDNICNFHCMENCDNPFHCKNDCREKCNCIIAPLSTGECVSPKSTLDQLRGWVANSVPDKISNSCGLHVHVSLKKDGYYGFLCDKEFYAHFIKWFTNWGKEMNFPNSHPYWTRLSGKNEFCHANYAKCGQHSGSSHTPEEQINQESKDGRKNPHRYAILNYAYKRTKTIECRMFPAFNDPAIIMSAIENMALCIEDYLENHRPKEQKAKAKVYANAL